MQVDAFDLLGVLEVGVLFPRVARVLIDSPMSFAGGIAGKRHGCFLCGLDQREERIISLRSRRELDHLWSITAGAFAI